MESKSHVLLKCPQTEVERGAPEQQMAAYRGNRNQKYTVKNATEQRNLGSLRYKIKCK
jgi:hypothetical protein